MQEATNHTDVSVLPTSAQPAQPAQPTAPSAQIPTPQAKGPAGKSQSFRKTVSATSQKQTEDIKVIRSDDKRGENVHIYNSKIREQTKNEMENAVKNEESREKMFEEKTSQFIVDENPNDKKTIFNHKIKEAEIDELRIILAKSYQISATDAPYFISYKIEEPWIKYFMLQDDGKTLREIFKQPYNASY